MNNMNDVTRKYLLETKENERHRKYLELLNSYTDEELENMSYFDLVKNGLAEDCDMGA